MGGGYNLAGGKKAMIRDSSFGSCHGVTSTTTEDMLCACWAMPKPAGVSCSKIGYRTYLMQKISITKQELHCKAMKERMIEL